MNRAEKVFYEHQKECGETLDMFKVMETYCPQDYGYGDNHGCEIADSEHCFKCWMTEVK